MKLTLSLFTLALAVPVFAAEAGQPTRAEVPLEHVFAPEGFDDNDVTQIVVAGQFPDTCHKVGPTEVRTSEKTGKLEVTQTAYRYSDDCQRAIVPFTQVVALGLLKAGDYDIDDMTSSSLVGRLSVARATKTTADDFLYAPVVDADVLRGEVEVRGTFTDRCTKLKNVIVKASKDSIVVQPIVTRYGDAAQCGFRLVPFRVRVKLPGNVTRGTYLLHVRSMSGQAINKVVSVRPR